MSILEVAHRLSEVTLHIGQVVQILHVALRGGGNDLDQKQVGELVFEAGLVEGIRVCGEILANCLNAGNGGDEGNGQAGE